MKEDILKHNLGKKNTEKRLSKMRDMQIRNSNKIIELTLQKLTRTQKMRKEE